MRCDRCRSLRLDKLLDRRLVGTGAGFNDAALALTSRNTRDAQS
jgi:hypothetical protein